MLVSCVRDWVGLLIIATNTLSSLPSGALEMQHKHLAVTE